MPERSYPFDGGDGAAIDENQWSYLSRQWQDNGVEAYGPSDDALKVSSQAAPLELIVHPGHAFLDGFHYHLDEIKTIFFGENPTNQSRIDRVVLRLDRAENTATVTVKQGVPADSPVPPVVDTSWETPELSLATFLIRGGTNTVAPSDVVDTRPFMGRRVRVADDLTPYPVGTVGYRPISDSWGLVRANKTVAQIATMGDIPDVDAAINAHAFSPNAHPEYMTVGQGDSRYATRGHVHTFTVGSPVIQAGSRYQSEYASGYGRAGVASISLMFLRTYSGGPYLTEHIGQVSAPYLPYGETLLPAYVFSADRATVTKAGAVRIHTDGDIETFDTYVGQGERIIVSGCYLTAPATIQTSQES